MRSVDEIWAGDLFGRKPEAEQLIGYLETVGIRPSLREDGHAYVLAVDAPYGEGKSFFLRRFAEHMAHTHPVAFVDAWTDDLEDEPLVALAATLDEALTPLADRSGELRDKINTFKTKAGAVAKIVAVGLLKRAASLVIMESGAEAVSDVISKPSDLTKDLGKDVLKEAAKEVVDGVAEGTTNIISGDMEGRIARFRKGRAAIEEMKASLRAVVEYLARQETYKPPIVIVIDELDRCRPTYAIKLLEEVKHLFDVEGLVFVLGTHGGALAHSVSAAYGSQFDGAAYLRRFFTRTYSLRDVRLDDLVEHLFEARALHPDRFSCPPVLLPDRNSEVLSPARTVSLYMRMYGFNARDAFAVTDALETATALTGSTPLLIPLLVPMLLSYMRGSSELLPVVNRPAWKLEQRDRFGRHQSEVDPIPFTEEMLRLSKMNDNDLMTAGNDPNASLATSIVVRYTFSGQTVPGRNDRPKDYSRLLKTVGRFKSGHSSSA